MMTRSPNFYFDAMMPAWAEETGRAAAPSSPLAQYVFSRDIGYPEKFRYAHKIQRLSQQRKEGIAALYAMMHFIDDLADDPNYGKQERNRNVEAFVRYLEGQVCDADPTPTWYIAYPTGHRQDGSAIQYLVAPFLETMKRYGLILQPFVRLAEVVSMCNRWPDEPHFASYEDLDHYNEILFQNVSDCLSDVLFHNIPADRRRTYNQGFKAFMKGMQTINLLMDLEEDAALGHYFFPVQGYNEGADGITPEAYIYLLILGNGFFEQADFLLRDERVEPDVRDFLAGLKEIHDDLRTSHFVLGRFQKCLGPRRKGQHPTGPPSPAAPEACPG